MIQVPEGRPTFSYTRFSPEGRRGLVQHSRGRGRPRHTITALASPPALVHRRPENTSPAPDTAPPPPHTSHKRRSGTKHDPPVSCVIPRYTRLQRNPS